MRQRQTRPRLIQSMIDAFTLPDLRRRLLLTLGILVVFRFVAHVPVPGVDQTKLNQMFKDVPLLGMLDLFSGGAMRQFSVAAMGVYPYITASIIMQLLVPVIPRLQAIAQEGEAGRNRINMITHWITVPLAALQGYGQLVLLHNRGVIESVGLHNMLPTTSMVLSMVAGTMFLVWLGELITEYGIGNGVSIIIFGGIVAGLPDQIGHGYLAAEGHDYGGLFFFIIIALVTAVLIVIFTEAHRRIPVQYARTMFRGGRMYRQGGSTHIPLRVNTAGMIPLIFAMSMVILPSTIATYFENSAGTAGGMANWINHWFTTTSWLYQFVYFFLVLGFTFFYTMVIFEQQNLADTLQKQGGFVPGIRPGRTTADYLNGVILRITWAGALFLAVVAIIPYIATRATNTAQLQLSSTGMLIMVGVALDTMRQMEAQLLMRRYEGFLR
jgi:preprotein translocase subunit SecY